MYRYLFSKCCGLKKYNKLIEQNGKHSAHTKTNNKEFPNDCFCLIGSSLYNKKKRNNDTAAQNKEQAFLSKKMFDKNPKYQIQPRSTEIKNRANIKSLMRA